MTSERSKPGIPGKFADLTVHLLFVVLSIYAIIYYKERLFADSSYYIFKVINDHSFRVEHGRFVLAISQILPLIAVFSMFSLKIILVLYSIGNVLFFYVLFLISRYYFKDTRAGILFVLLQTIGILWGFYVPMFELYYGSALLVLFSIMFERKDNGFFGVIILCILEILILTSHPFCFFLFLYVLLFHFIKTGYKFSSKYFIYISLLLGTLIFKRISASDYEAAKTTAFFETLQNGSYDLEYVKSLVIFLFIYYKEVLAIFIFTSIFLISGRYYKGFIIYFLSFLLILAVINVSNYGVSHSRYQEQVYFPLIFIIVFPFYKYVLSSLKNYPFYFLFIFVVILIIIRLAMIRNEGLKFSHRVADMNYLINYCQPLAGNKFLVREENIANENGIDLNWSFPIETMLISGLSRSHKTITICSGDDTIFPGYNAKLSDDDYLLRLREIFPDNTLNPKYFHLMDGKYVKINQCGVESARSVSFLSKIKIIINNNIKKMKHGSCIYFPLTIINDNIYPVYSSCSDNLSISYHWKKNDSIEDVNEFRTPVIADITKKLSQDIVLYCPDRPGKYLLVIDMIIENNKWLNIDCKSEIEIY